MRSAWEWNKLLDRSPIASPCLWSGRNTARAAVGGELPVRTLSVVRRVPSSAIAHVSASPLCHPGRSDFPSPVGDHDFPPTVFPYPTRLKRSLAFTPLGSGLPPVSTKLALSPHSQVLSPGRWALPCPSWPRVPSPFPGITLPGAASRRLGPALPDRLRSYGLMRQTGMLRGPSLSLGPSVFAGCCEPLLQTGPSRHYLCNLCPGAWTPTRRRSPGALARFFPGDVGLTSQRTGSARQTIPAWQLPQGGLFPGCSHSLMFRLPDSLGLQVAPAASFEGRPGRLHRASLGWLPAPSCGIATCVNEQFTRLDFLQLDCSLVGCSPLPLPSPLLYRARSRPKQSRGKGKGKEVFAWL